MVAGKRDEIPPPASLREATAKLKASNDRLERELLRRQSAEVEADAGTSGEWLLNDLQAWRIARAKEREAALKGKI